MELNEKELHAVILGGLLHDIGKFVQRAQSNPRAQNHSQWGEEWYEENLAEKLTPLFSEEEKQIVRSAISNHHFSEKYISLADGISAGMDRIELEDEERSDPFSDRLISIFSKIFQSDKLNGDHCHQLSPLCSDGLNETFPIGEKQCTSRDYEKLLYSFENELRALDFGRMPTYKVVNMLYSLLLRYTWCIPSAAYKHEPDVSLLDHLKTTAAIAGALYIFEKENAGTTASLADSAFTLIIGDLSGIQNYIFNISHMGAGGVAKRLRARSFQLNIFSDSISHKILDVFNLPITNIIMSSGGKFYILLPNTEKTTSAIEAIKKETDNWLYERFHGEININIASISLSGEDFSVTKYGAALKTLNSYLLKMKKRPLKTIFSVNGKWKSEKFVLDVDFEKEEKLCRACRKFAGDKRSTGDYICKKCSNDEKIGRVLPQTRYIAFFKNNSGQYPAGPGYSFDLHRDIRDVRGEYYLLHDIGNTSNNTGHDAIQRFVANHISHFGSSDDCERCEKIDCTDKEEVKEGYPKSFQCIAYESDGKKMLGYIKADVDNLGAVFAFGFRDNSSVSRLATLSRMLDTFFSGFLQKLLEIEYPELYTVFSGGDDLLIIGPWDSIVNFAEQLNLKFREFTGNNPHLTLSAGLVFTKSNYPVFRAVSAAENALDMSKDQKGKDSVTVFGHTVKWEIMPDILGDAEKLKKWLKDKEVSSGFAHNLLLYSDMNRKFRETNMTEYLRFLPLMTYDIARNLPSLNHKNPIKREIRLWAEELKDMANNKLMHTQITANYALTANRGGRDE